MTRKNEGQYIQRSQRLFQEYIVDNYVKIEDARLTFLRTHQDKFRATKINLLKDAYAADADPKLLGKRIVLPSSFVGSPRHMYQLYQDAMSIVRKLGKPDLFITITANPNWPEIKRELLSGQKPADRPDLIARQFRLKLKHLLSQIIKGEIFGKVIILFNFNNKSI